ncbi:MAG: FkbM family methyltransferase [Labilithrix sp.]|nr:FkbM family methyltransferase [Labilithrix sp.]MCW5814006.1 FkbM family methyltransferase [Labilithrix sp.]
MPPLNSFPEVSFAQQGEDLIIKSIFAALEIANATYLDVGAHDPIRGSNTYLFYALGSRGVVVEPNPAYVAKLKAARPRDVVIDKGIGIGKATKATYYDFGDDGQENTFSKEQVDRLAKLGIKPLRTSEMELVDINDVIATHFPNAPPDLVSIDTEGLDLEILKSLDFERFRPPVLCVETLEVGTTRTIDEIAAFLHRKRYVTRGGTLVNTIFVSQEALAHTGASDGGTAR